MELRFIWIEVIDDLLFNKTDDLIEKYKDLKGKVLNETGDRILTKYENTGMIIDKFPNKMKEVKNDIKLMFYNKKGIVMETRKLLDKNKKITNSKE
jgi:hypothetical protein